jgi:hypothetical protein
MVEAKPQFDVFLSYNRLDRAVVDPLTAATTASAICGGIGTRHLRRGGGADHFHNGALLGVHTFGAPGGSIHTRGGTSRIGGRVRTR